MVVVVFLHQRQLVGIGSGGLAHGLLHGPEPRQIHMGLAKHGEFRRCGTVFAGQKGLQHLSRPENAPGHLRLRKLKIRDIRKFFQPLNDLHGPQALLRKPERQRVQGQIVHGSLEKGLIPHAEAGFPQGYLQLRRLGYGFLPPGHRTGAFVSDAVAGIAFRHDLIDRTRPGRPGKGDRSVAAVDGTGFPAVDPDQHFLRRGQGNGNALTLQLPGDDHPGAKPAIFPLPAPLHSRGCGGKRPRHRLRVGQVLHGGKKRHAQRGIWFIIVLRKLLRPDPQAVAPLSADVHKITLVLCLPEEGCCQYRHSMRNSMASA